MRKVVLSTIFLSVISLAAIITITVDDRLSFGSYVEKRDYGVIVSVENTGSVTCVSQAKLFDGKQRFWSARKEIKPGGIEALDIYYISPYNHSINATVYVYFCDEVKEVGSFSFEPSTIRKGKVDVKISVYPDRIVAEGNATVIPFNNPSNFNIPTFRVNGKEEVSVYYPRELSGNVTFLVSNGINYSIITVPVSQKFPWKYLLIAGLAILYVLVRKLKHGLGKDKNGRHSSKKGKGRAKRHAKS